MDYESKQISSCWWLVLCSCFALLYVPFLGTAPLSRLEAIAALGTAEPGIAVGGELGVVTYPLYPWLVSFFRFLVGHNEWAVRMPSLISVVGLTGIGALFAHRAAGGERTAMIVAACMTFLPIMMIIGGRQASGHVLTALLLSAAWFMWYWLGHEKKRWYIVWPLVLALVLAAALHTGPKAFAWFYLPLFFLRRPFRIWRRLRMFGHLAVLLPVAVFYLYWIHGQIEVAFLLPLETALSQPPAGFSRFFTFLASSFLLLLPAPFFFWPGFCVAFRAVEKNRELASFLRTLIIPLFLIIWLLPRGYPADLTVLIVPLAALAGMHYEILLRRHRYVFARILSSLETVVLALALTVLLFWLLVVIGIAEIAPLNVTYQVLALATSLGTAAAMLAMRYCRDSVLPCWFRVTSAVVFLHLLFVSGWTPVQALFNRMEYDQAALLRQNVPENEVVYNLTSRALVKESFYLRRPVNSLDSAANLPAEGEKTVYVLGGYNPPLSERFFWTSVSELVDTTGEYFPVIEWFPEHGTAVRVERDRKTSSQPPALVGVRIYQGVPRPEREEAVDNEED